MSRLTTLVTSPFSLLPSGADMAALPTTIYCTTIGIGCSARPKKEVEVARLARSVASHAHQAHDIFQSVIRLGDPGSLGLYHPEMWELAIAVRATTRLPSKEDLGRKLNELGDMTRDVKDSVIGINSRAINAFSCAPRHRTVRFWMLTSCTGTVAEFRRAELMIGHMQASGACEHPHRFRVAGLSPPQTMPPTWRSSSTRSSIGSATT
jgi:hypothetical protein